MKDRAPVPGASAPIQNRPAAARVLRATRTAARRGHRGAGPGGGCGSGHRERGGGGGIRGRC